MDMDSPCHPQTGLRRSLCPQNAVAAPNGECDGPSHGPAPRQFQKLQSQSSSLRPGPPRCVQKLRIRRGGVSNLAVTTESVPRSRIHKAEHNLQTFASADCPARKSRASWRNSALIAGSRRRRSPNPKLPFFFLKLANQVRSLRRIVLRKSMPVPSRA